MFFSAKSTGFVLDQGEQTTLLARVSGLRPPFSIEAIREFPSGDGAAFDEAVAALKPKNASGYLHANCGVNPPGRFIRRATLDPKRLKETEYLAEVVTGQFRIDAEKSIISVLNAFDGLDFDAAKPNPQKEVVFCGLPIEEQREMQSAILERGLFPARMELSSLNALGAIIDFLKFSDSQKPTLVLELGAESTQSYIVSSRGLEATRPIAVGLDAMVPVVQKELGLKDEESARKLFFSNTFDFTGMGSSLCRRLLKELQSSMGFYEVQTGQSISQLICPVLPEKLAWLEAVIAAQIGVAVLQPDFGPWLAARQVTVADAVPRQSLSSRHLALLGLMIPFNSQTNNAAVS
jgi:hypothetical protein